VRRYAFRVVGRSVVRGHDQDSRLSSLDRGDRERRIERTGAEYGTKLAGAVRKVFVPESRNCGPQLGSADWKYVRCNGSAPKRETARESRPTEWGDGSGEPSYGRG